MRSHREILKTLSVQLKEEDKERTAIKANKALS